MKMNRYTYGFFLLIAVFGIMHFSSFDQSQNQEIDSSDLIPPLVQKELNRKIYKYQKTILDKCKKKAFEAAEFYIDSLVAEELKFQSSDTIKFPAKPIKPILRDPIILNDSTAITPILK